MLIAPELWIDTVFVREEIAGLSKKIAVSAIEPRKTAFKLAPRNLISCPYEGMLRIERNVRSSKFNLFLISFTP
jgi:hypothetical protein